MRRIELVQVAVLRGLLRLPAPLQRVLAGRPVERDGRRLAVETQLLLKLNRLSGHPPAETLPIPRGREVIRFQSLAGAGDQPIGSVRDLDAGGVPARLYVPTTSTGADPLLVLAHGGGWIYGDLDTHDATCRVLAERAGVRVLSVDYRLAPEHPFPAAFDDVVTALGWAREHTAELGVDPERIGTGGDSAGGNLAAGVAIEATRRGWPLAFQLLVYPVTDTRGESTSRTTFSEGFFLTAGFMDLAQASYLPEPWMGEDPRVDLARAELPAGLPPAWVCTAGFDPLRDEGRAFADRLAAAGVRTEHVEFDDQIHSFFNVVGAGRRSRACVEEIGDALRRLAHP